MTSLLHNRPTGIRWAAVIAGGALTAAVLAGCGSQDSAPDPDPSVNADTAQNIVDLFVRAYNQNGLETAVEQTFCTDSMDQLRGQEALGGGTYVAGSLAEGAPAAVAGTTAHGTLTLSGGTSSFTVALTDDPSQGWCITGTTQIPGSGSSPTASTASTSEVPSTTSTAPSTASPAAPPATD
ncbi:MAG: hypothetical protein QM774_07930 [Gordonia sp. (in: high G+C Gram-positive bacteria)]|uniref:hypothetical protein n=1 Tax=Gordonia sp. (in: high G+C Gram-positive bacteria) TaxID=84139 RepID=UPI0039E29A20